MSGPYRFLPSSFDPDDPHMRGIPVPLDWRWSSIEEGLRVRGARGVMVRLPLFWQMEVPLFYACRAVGAFLFANDVGNMPLGAAAIQGADIDTVITNFENADAFAVHLTERQISLPKNWVIVRTPLNAQTSLSQILQNKDLSIFEETHSSPGIALPNI